MRPPWETFDGVNSPLLVSTKRSRRGNHCHELRDRRAVEELLHVHPPGVVLAMYERRIEHRQDNRCRTAAYDTHVADDAAEGQCQPPGRHSSATTVARPYKAIRAGSRACRLRFNIRSTG